MILKRNVYHHSRDIRYKSLVCNLSFLPCCHVPSVSCFRDKSSVREQFETNVVTQDMPVAIHTYIYNSFPLRHSLNARWLPRILETIRLMP